MAKSAFRIWEDVDCSFLMFRYMGTTTIGAIKGDGKNVIEWVNELPGGAKPGAIGLGGPLFNGKGEIYEGNVWIKAQRKPDSFISLVIAHEVGHAVGFGHSEVKGSIMYPASSYKTHLTQDDIDLVCNAYPADVNTCTETAHCPKGLVCRGGKCVKCITDGDCDSGHYCFRELCIPNCKGEEDCEPKGTLCVQGKCTPCESDRDCGEERFCESGVCKDKCKTDDDCAREEKCRENGRCIPRGGCLKNEECEEGEVCIENRCKGLGKLGKLCMGAADCDEGQECVAHDCQVDLDCLKGYICKKTGSSGTCVKPKSESGVSICSMKCSDKEQCPGGFICKPFSDTVSLCYPERRKPPQKPKETDSGSIDNTEQSGGCGCYTAGLDGLNSMPTWLVFLPILLGIFRRRKV